MISALSPRFGAFHPADRARLDSPPEATTTLPPIAAVRQAQARSMESFPSLITLYELWHRQADIIRGQIAERKSRQVRSAAAACNHVGRALDAKIQSLDADIARCKTFRIRKKAGFDRHLEYRHKARLVKQRESLDRLLPLLNHAQNAGEALYRLNEHFRQHPAETDAVSELLGEDIARRARHGEAQGQLQRPYLKNLARQEMQTEQQKRDVSDRLIALIRLQTALPALAAFEAMLDQSEVEIPERVVQALIDTRVTIQRYQAQA